MQPTPPQESAEGSIQRRRRLAPRSPIAIDRGVRHGPGWWPAAAFLSVGISRVAAGVRRDRRPATVSLLFSSYVKGIAAPVVARFCLDGRTIDPAVERVWVRLEKDQVTGVSFDSDPENDGDDAGGLPVLIERLLNTNLAQAVDAVRPTVRLSRRNLWGTVASGLVTSLRNVSWLSEDPGILAEPARKAVEGDPRLRGLCAVDLLPYGGRQWLTCRRATCCLRYRVRPAENCAGCSRLTAKEREVRNLMMVAKFARNQTLTSPRRCPDLGCVR